MALMVNVLSHALNVQAGFIPGIELRLHCFNVLPVNSESSRRDYTRDARDSMDLQWQPMYHEQAYEYDVTRSESAVLS